MCYKWGVVNQSRAEILMGTPESAAARECLDEVLRLTTELQKTTGPTMAALIGLAIDARLDDYFGERVN